DAVCSRHSGCCRPVIVPRPRSTSWKCSGRTRIPCTPISTIATTMKPRSTRTASSRPQISPPRGTSMESTGNPTVSSGISTAWSAGDTRMPHTSRMNGCTYLSIWPWAENGLVPRTARRAGRRTCSATTFASGSGSIDEQQRAPFAACPSAWRRSAVVNADMDSGAIPHALDPERLFAGCKHRDDFPAWLSLLGARGATVLRRRNRPQRRFDLHNDGVGRNRTTEPWQRSHPFPAEHRTVRLAADDLGRLRSRDDCCAAQLHPVPSRRPCLGTIASSARRQPLARGLVYGGHHGLDCFLPPGRRTCGAAQGDLGTD